jgi:lipopolysaccharide transport system permease protein
MRYLDLVFFLVYMDLRTEVARRLLGFLWWILEPVLFMSVFYLVFGLGLRHGGSDYVTFLLCGMVSWKWFDGSVRQAGTSIIGNTGLMQQVYVHKAVFGLVQILTNTFKFMIVLLLLIGFLLATGHHVSVEWFGLVPLILTQFLLIVAGGLLLAAMIPFAHDLKQVVDNLLMLLMFMSGIIVNIDTMPETWGNVLRLNPMVGLIDAYRQVLMHNMWPDWHNLGYSAGLSLPILAVALFIIVQYDRHYPKLIY